MLKNMQAQLRAAITVSPEHVARFFKTDAGTYGAKDQFLGVTVPKIREVARVFKEAPFADLSGLLTSSFNEERLLALLILVHQYQSREKTAKEEVFQFYVNNLAAVNNWNLVDASAHHIIGAHLYTQDNKVLLVEFTQDTSLWVRRIAMVATWYFIKQKNVDWTLKIATLLLKDPEDLIHKAVGWMLRETGKQNRKALLEFLDTHTLKMPRTTLRYALERLDPNLRQHYMQLR